MQNRVTSSTARGFYTLALLLVLFPLQELFVTAWPLRFGEISWRYAVFGLAANFLYRPVAGLALAIALAYWLGHPLVMRAAGVAALLVAALILPLMAVFAFDLPAMAELRGAQGTNTLIAGGIQEIKYGLTVLASGLLGWGALETSRRMAAEEERRARASPGTLRASAG